MKRVKVSITVPVYKVEKDLARCIESLINQSLKDIEIILVDDGSPDRCGEICDKYASIDSRIKVIHKENGGLASARQAGLNAITGEYYTVCDSDDWIEPNAYETLYNFAKETDADIVLSDYYINYPNGKETKNSPYIYTNQDQFLLDSMEQKAPISTWSKLFKVDTIRQYHIGYEANINLGEDALFLYKILKHPIKISQINKAFYHYQRDINGGSYTNNITEASLKQNEWILLWKKENFTDNKYQHSHIISAISLCFTALRAKDLDSNKYRSYSNYVSSLDIISNNLFSIKSIVVLITKLFGYKIGKTIIEIAYKTFYR